MYFGIYKKDTNIIESLQEDDLKIFDVLEVLDIIEKK